MDKDSKGGHLPNGNVEITYCTKELCFSMIELLEFCFSHPLASIHFLVGTQTEFGLMTVFFLTPNNIISLPNICDAESIRINFISSFFSYILVMIDNLITQRLCCSFLLIHLFRLEILGGESLQSH